MSARVVLVTALPGAGDAEALAAVTGVASWRRIPELPVIVAAEAERVRRPALLAAQLARETESRLRDAGHPAAARGGLCFSRVGAGADALPELASAAGAAALLIAALCPARWRAELEHGGVAAAALLADRHRHRSQAALLAIDLRRRGIPAAVVLDRPGVVATRRAFAGIDPGGPIARRAARISARVAAERAQALPLLLGALVALVAAASALALAGATLTAAGRVQRAADLAAVSAARSLRDDHAAVLAPRLLPDGNPNPHHIAGRVYRRRAVRTARLGLRRNGVDPATARISFPGDDGLPPTTVKVAVRGRVGGGPLEAAAVAQAFPAAGGDPADAAANATGGGYGGPLAYRQGEPMRPDVAVAYDRMAIAATGAGISLYVNSGFRSDAEQAALFAAHPDPRWVAPPGTSLHRCGTELDLGPPAAYGWLAANAARFDFVRRYEWEPWHFGYVGGPAPCSAAGDAGGAEPRLAGRGLPGFTPPEWRDAIAASASRWNVQPALLAAQLFAESGFNPLAVSSAGASGIAQFMPATAAAYGLTDPFDPVASIDAQAHLMHDLLEQFGSAALALAAYNAGAAPVAACRCVPAIPETTAYVARILGLLGAAGMTAPPELEVRLVR